MSEFKVGGVYKCGNGYVKIVKDMREEEGHPHWYYQFIGIESDRSGCVKTCATGMFDEVGAFYVRNDERLRHKLEPIKSQRQKDYDALMQQIAELEEQAVKLKP